MADGGAGSKDAFRIPSAGEELTYPLSQFVVRYGHTARLSTSTAALAGLLAGLPPSMEEPYRLIFFVVTDQRWTTIAVLRAVLKEGLEAPSRLPRALIIDQLHTLEVFRKQGLATSLVNFVKGIAEAHEIELYSSCGMYQRRFWEMRGFEEELSLDMLRACSCVDDLVSTSMLLRAGAGYTEYQPANGERLSITRPFDLSGGVCDEVYSYPLSGPGFRPPSGRGVAEDYDIAAGGACAGSAAAAATGGRVLTGERLARHDEEEEAKRLAMSAPDAEEAGAAGAAGGFATAGGAMLTAESETAAAAAALTAARGGYSLAQQRAAVGGWPGVGIGPAAAAAVAQTSGVNAAVAGYLGWTPSDRLIGAATAGADAAAAAAEAADKRAMAARGLLAIPSSGDGQGHGGDVVDLTGGIGGRSLAEQDEEQMQLAIAMSLSAAEATGSGGGGGGGDGAGGGREAAGDDTETEEDVDYGARLSGGDGDTAERSGSPPGERTEADSSGSSDSGGRARGGRGSRGLAEAGGHHPNHGGSRRTRRRRDESGASTSGEQSPSGADGGGAEMELDDAGVGVAPPPPPPPPPPPSALAPLNAAAHSNVSSFCRAGSLGISDPSGRGSGRSRIGAAAACAGAGGTHGGVGGVGGVGSPANVCMAAATGGADENYFGAAAAPSNLPCSSSSRPSRPPSPSPSSSSSCSFSLEPREPRRRAARAKKQAAAAAAAAGSLGHGGPCDAEVAAEVAASMSQKENGEHTDACYGHPAAAGQEPPRGQRQQHQQLQVSIPGDGGGMIGALGGIVAPLPGAAGCGPATAGVSEAAGLGAGGGGGDLGAGGGFISDDLGANDMLLRDFGVAPGALDEKLLAVAGWHGEDNDDELRRVMEASRQTHEEEMLQRATQESQEAAAAEAAAAAAVDAHHLPHPPRAAATAAASLSWPPSSSTTAPANASGGGPDVAVLPMFGSAVPPQNRAGHTNGTAHPGTGGGSGASGFQAGGGAGGVSATGSGAPWMDDGEVMSFAGNGKGKGRCRD